MKELKEHEMDCDYSLELSCGSSSSGKRPFVTPSESSVNMKRLKSFGHSTDNISTQNNSNNDIGYESDSPQSTEPEDEEVRADINAIVVEDENALHNKLASFVFELFTWPIHIVLAIDSESTDLDMYVRFIKELGVLAKLQEDESSNLLVVGMAPNCTGEFNTQARHLIDQQRDKLQVETLNSYFGSYFDACEINQLSCKIRQSLHKDQCHPCKEAVGRKTANAFMKGNHFLETKTCEKELLTLFIEKKLLFCFNSGNKEFVCKPEYLINEFDRALTKMSDVKYRSKFLDFMTLIDDVQGRKAFIDAFREAGVIHIVQIASHETVHIMPLIFQMVLPDFDELEYSVDTNALQVKVKLDIIPNFVTANIIKLLYKDDWTLRSSAPCGTTDSFVFEKHSRGLIVQVGVLPQSTSFICLCGLRNACHKELYSDNEWEQLRELIEGELKKWNDVPTTVDNFISYLVKPKEKHDSKSILEMDARWTDVETFDQLKGVDVIDLLSPWFYSKVKAMEVELSKRMSDAFLADISTLFGYGTKLFFVSAGLKSELISTIEMDNPRSTKDATYKMLLEWRKLKGLEGNIATLRSAIKDSTHVTVNLHDFDEKVEKHHGKN